MTVCVSNAYERPTPSLDENMAQNWLENKIALGRKGSWGTNEFSLGDEHRLGGKPRSESNILDSRLKMGTAKLGSRLASDSFESLNSICVCSPSPQFAVSEGVPDGELMTQLSRDVLD